MSTAQIFVGQSNRTEALKNADRLWHLQKTGLTDGLSLREMHSLASACIDVIYSKDKIIFSQGDTADALLLVNRGAIRLTSTDPQGREKIVGILATGDVFGEESLNTPATRKCHASAHEETWISLIESQTLERLIKEIPELSHNLLKLLTEKLSEAREEIETLSFSGTEQRIAKTLLKLSSSHGKRIVSPEPLKKLRFPVSHEFLAQMIGANRPHVSAIMSDFKKRGWVKYQRRKLLINVPALENMLGLIDKAE
jgi:CRP/FNR family transcriptional regulator